MKKFIKAFAIILPIIFFAFFSGCAKPDYSFCAGYYKLVEASGGTQLSYSSFNWFNIQLDAKGDYSFDYSLKTAENPDTRSSGEGKFSLAEDKLTLTKSISASGYMNEGYFSINVVINHEDLKLIFVIS